MAEGLNPRDAIDQFLKNKLTGTSLLRSLTGYKGWRVPARLEDMVPVFNSFDLGHGTTHFFLFSDKDAYLQCRNQIGVPLLGEYYIDHVSGYNAFAGIREGVSVVNVNPYCDQHIQYSGEQIAVLKAWSAILRTEHALDAAQTQNDKSGYGIIRSFAGYYFIMEDDQFISLVPDGEGRKYAAIFTAEDALYAFIETRKANLKPIVITGTVLFDSIRKMPLDGLVFNCSGPTKPRAFPISFAEEVLTATE